MRQLKTNETISVVGAKSEINFSNGSFDISLSSPSDYVIFNLGCLGFLKLNGDGNASMYSYTPPHSLFSFGGWAWHSNFDLGDGYQFTSSFESTNGAHFTLSFM